MDVALPTYRDAHSRRGAAELRAGSHSEALDTRLPEDLRRKDVRQADLVQKF